MTDYRAPVSDMRFVLEEIADLPKIAALPGYEDATPDLVDAVLEEAGKLASELLAPLNQKGEDLLISAPSEAAERQLKELHIRLAPPLKMGGA